MEDLTGKQFGPYQIVSPLGEGGMAAVYKAYQPGIDRYVAIKVLPKHFAQDPQFFERFEQEAKLLAKLQHPHILPIHDYGKSDGYTYMVMPLVEGGDLNDLLTGKRFTLEETEQVVSQVGDALDYAHTQGIVHRDVKPSNILIDPRGNCLLTDFGIAKLVEGSSSLTGTGNIIGTPDYMSPEQGLGKKLDGRSDIYALGVILYEMVTGQVPYRAETPMAVVVKHIQDPLPPPSKADPTISESVERVILKSLAKQPDDRYATPDEMVKAFQSAVQSATAAQVTKPVDDRTRLGSGFVAKTAQPAPQSSSNSMMMWAIIAVVVLLLLAGLVLGGLWFFAGARRAAPPPAPPQQPAVQPTATEFELPTAAPPTNTPLPASTSTPVVAPTDTPVPTSPPAVEPTQPPPPPTQPPADQQPPQPPPDQPPDEGQTPPIEALRACQALTQGDSCTFTAPRGAINGTCRTVLNQLACVPEGAPLPPGN